MLNKQTNKVVAFLLGVLLLATVSCENQGSVDSLTEDNGINEHYRENIQSDFLQNRSKLKTSPLTTTEGLTDEMKKLLQSRGFDLNQVQRYETSEKTYWVAGESLSGFPMDDTEVGLRYMIDPCFEEEFTDLDCYGFPSPPPSPPEPVGAVYAAFDSYVTTSSASGQVQMGTWSVATQPIDYMGVSGLSSRDNVSLGLYFDQGPNRFNAIVNITPYKPGFPTSPPMSWDQDGEHYFEYAGGVTVVSSSDSEDF